MSVRRGNLGERISGATVTGKAAYEDKAPCPLGRLYRRCLFHPLQSEPYRDGRCLPLLHERDKPRQQECGIMHLETQAAAQLRDTLARPHAGCSSRTSRPRLSQGAQRADIHPGVNRGGLWALMPKNFADLGQRSAPLQHAHCQGVAKLM